MQSLFSSGILKNPPRLLLNYGGPLDIAKVGSGHCDAMFEIHKGFKPRDLAAGLHIAEAGGAFSAVIGGGVIEYSSNRDERRRFIVAATQPLLEEMQSILSAHPMEDGD